MVSSDDEAGATQSEESLGDCVFDVVDTELSVVEEGAAGGLEVTVIVQWQGPGLSTDGCPTIEVIVAVHAEIETISLVGGGTMRAVTFHEPRRTVAATEHR